MDAIITISSSNYGGGFIVHNWNLNIETTKGLKSFYLGQDAKFCSRVLGMRGSDVAEAIGTNDLRPDESRKKLANFILEALELDEEKIAALQEWELCCQ